VIFLVGDVFVNGQKATSGGLFSGADRTAKNPPVVSWASWDRVELSANTSQRLNSQIVLSGSSDSVCRVAHLWC